MWSFLKLGLCSWADLSCGVVVCSIAARPVSAQLVVNASVVRLARSLA